MSAARAQDAGRDEAAGAHANASGGAGARAADAGSASCTPGGECWWWKDAGACRSAAVPALSARPMGPDDQAPDFSAPGDIYLGWTELKISAAGESADASQPQAPFGLDLDGVCTTDDKGCQPGMQTSCRSHGSQTPLDSDGCRDNAFANLMGVASLIPPLGSMFGLGESQLNCGLRRGSFNMLMRVRGYNGATDDPNVRVDWYTSPGLEKPPDWSCGDGSDHTNELPWRFSAKWRVTESELSDSGMDAAGLPDSLIADPSAYVKQGYLVTRMPDGAAVRLAGDGKPFRGFHLPLQGGVWLGHLRQRQDNTWAIDDGLVAGRARVDDVKRSLHEVGFCAGAGYDMFYGSLVMFADDNADVSSNGQNDPDAMCDALSVGIAFQATQITPGMAGPIEPLVTCCGPGMSSDDCQAECGDGKVSGNEACDTAIAAGAAGACPTPTECRGKKKGCEDSVLQGNGCFARCVATPITAFVKGDDCCPQGANASQDSDCQKAICGNNVLEPGETCDPPSSCRTCQTFNACLRLNMSGSAQSCTLACKYDVTRECQNGDGCCPEGCDHAHDDDCSDQCGDGKIEADRGETCEAGVSGKECPSSCDDMDPCTTDYATGSAATCNRSCSHVPIAQPVNGDGCCRRDDIHANANTDSDCAPVCGNGVLEPTEECDDGNRASGDACSPDCKAVDQVAQCLKAIGLSDDCSKCICAMCPAETSSCYASPQKDLNNACLKLARCFRVKHCTGFDCYCAQDWLNCEADPQGPCRAETEAAAGSDVLPTIVSRLQDPSTAIGRANAVGNCGWNSCASQCGS